MDSLQGKKKVQKPKPVFVTKGLEAQDENIDILERYFDEMKQVTVEPACGGDLDLFTFAACSLWFGVIAIHGEEDCDEVYEEDDTNVSSGASVDVDIEALHHPLLHRDLSSLSVDEIDVFWEEAFRDEMDEKEKREEIYGTGSIRDIIGRDTPDPEDPHILESPPMTSLPPSSNYEFHIPFATPPPQTPDPIPSDDDYDQIFNMEDGAEATSSDNWATRARPTHRNEVLPLSFPKRNRKHIRPFGEYFEREVKRKSSHELLLEADPQYQERQAALQLDADRIRDEMRLERVVSYQKKLKIRAGLLPADPPVAQKPKPKAQSAPPAPGPRIPSPEPFMCTSKHERYTPIGLVYLSTSQNYEDPMHLGECTLGFYVDPAHRHRPTLSMALDAVAAVAFRDHACHRLQAIVVDNPDKLYALQMLASAGFTQEGLRRRSFFSPIGHEYKNLHYLAMLAMEWSFDLNSSTRIRPQSLWDEVISRHRWEQEEILRLEDRSLLKRSRSTETIREATSFTAAAEDILEAETTNSPSKRRRLVGEMRPYRRPRGSISSRASSIASSSSHSPSGYDTGFESDWSIVSSLARFSLPSSPGSSNFTGHDDTDGYMSSASDMSIIRHPKQD